MTSQTSAAYEKYYVPEKSRLAVCATIGLILTIFGAASIMNDMTFGDPASDTNSWTIFNLGMLFFGVTLFAWFRTAIKENIAGMNSAQLKKSYVLGMFWFIFSEVMFFFAFFGRFIDNGRFGQIDDHRARLQQSCSRVAAADHHRRCRPGSTCP